MRNELNNNPIDQFIKENAENLPLLTTLGDKAIHNTGFDTPVIVFPIKKYGATAYPLIHPITPLCRMFKNLYIHEPE